VDVIADGLQSHAWREPQLGAFQEQLKKINLSQNLAETLEFEAAENCWAIGNLLKKYPKDPSLWQKMIHFRLQLWDWMPHGWVYQNMVTIANLDYKQLDGFDSEKGIILPDKVENQSREMKNLLNHFSPYTFVAAEIGFTDNPKEMQILAYNQTLANEGQIACALERYKLANGNYPETLDALAPQFMEKLPHDIIGGQPLHYRRTDDGKFLLYSVGWNETDDGGQVSLTKDGDIDYTRGDWVWCYPTK
jgi:hypothetical protein